MIDTQYKSLYLVQDYIRELGNLLILLGNANDPGACHRLEQLTVEVCEVAGCLKALNPTITKAALTDKLHISSTATSYYADDADFDPAQVNADSYDYGTILFCSTC